MKISSSIFIGAVMSLFSSCKDIKSPTKEFEGTVTYGLHIVSKNKNVDTRDIQRKFGNQMIYTYKNGNYKMEFNGPESPTIYYRAKDNYQYTIFPDSDTMWTTDCTLEPLKLLNFKTLDQEVNVLNAHCKIIESELEGDLKYVFTYDPNRYIAPHHFIGHRLGHVNRFYEEGKGLILQYKRMGKNFDLTQTALKIEEMEINPIVFKLPELPKKEMSLSEF